MESAIVFRDSTAKDQTPKCDWLACEQDAEVISTLQTQYVGATIGVFCRAHAERAWVVAQNSHISSRAWWLLTKGD